MNIRVDFLISSDSHLEEIYYQLKEDFPDCNIMLRSESFLVVKYVRIDGPVSLQDLNISLKNFKDYVVAPLKQVISSSRRIL